MLEGLKKCEDFLGVPSYGEPLGEAIQTHAQVSNVIFSHCKVMAGTAVPLPPLWLR